MSLHVAREPAVLEPRDYGRAVGSGRSGWKGRLWRLRQRCLGAIGEERAVPPVLRAMTRAGIGDAGSRRERGVAGEEKRQDTAEAQHTNPKDILHSLPIVRPRRPAALIQVKTTGRAPRWPAS